MSIWHPETAEDKMAWVPIIGCFVPMAIMVIVVVVTLVTTVGW